MNSSTRERIGPDDLPAIEAEMERYHRRERPWSLGFPQKLERSYCERRVVGRRRYLTFQGLLALLVYDLFIVGDVLISPQHLMRSVVVRFGIVTPIVLISTLVLRRSSDTRIQDGSGALLCVLGAISVLYLHHGTGMSGAMQAEPGLLLVLVAITVLLRLELPFAALATAGTYAAEIVYLFTEHALTHAEKWTAAGRVFWMAVLALVGAYMLLRERRLSWLREKRGQLQGILLSESNAALMSLSTTDHLTGLANRKSYEERLEEMWQEAAASDREMAAVIVDVDFFKQINDSFGHPYGDRVLQRVANLILQSLREEDDFAARIGGEEFAVLLPDSGLEAARLVAERIRTIVEVAGSPAATRHDVTPIANQFWCTVSCGVASMEAHAGASPQRLIEAADLALYEAKRAGRNRVCADRDDAPPPHSIASRVVVFPGAG